MSETKPTQKTVLLRSQRAAIAKLLADKALSPLEFRWEDVESLSLQDTSVPRIVHIQSEYSFTFDRDIDPDDDRKYWVCRFSPGTEVPSATMDAYTWDQAKAALDRWTSALKRELTAEDPWADQQEEFANGWTGSNDKFTATELQKLHLRLDEVKNYLIEQSDKSEASIALIQSGIEDLKASAETFGKKDWATLFIGWFFMHCADWAVSQVHWQHIVTLLLKGTKSFLLQG